MSVNRIDSNYTYSLKKKDVKMLTENKQNDPPPP